jgi:ZIP family zinc transporter/zinc and cadmium transporter
VAAEPEAGDAGPELHNSMTASFAFALIAVIANFLGGLMVVSNNRAQRSLRYFMAVGSGFMLGTVFLEMVPAIVAESAQLRSGRLWPALMLGGYMIVHFFEHTFAPHLHFGEETHRDEMNVSIGISAFIGMLVHTFFDGVAIGAAFGYSSSLGLLVFLAMFLHKIPDGFTVASIVMSTGHKASRAMAACGMLGLATLAGVLAFHLAGAGQAYALPIAAGCTLYVAASDLIPEVNRETGVRMALLVFAGMGLFLLIRGIAPEL